jgi:hypothetical protein
MKSRYLLVSFVLAGLQGISTGAAFASYPADAEASYNLPAPETYADRIAASEGSAPWGVSRREVQPHDPFPFGGGFLDD